MSNPTRSQQRFPFRTTVRVRRNYPTLPPITPTTPSSRYESEPTALSSSLGHIDLQFEATPRDTRNLWVRLNEDITKEQSKFLPNHGNQRTATKVVRIFVSSTFTDFFNEREILIKRVFPWLRDDLEYYGIQIIDCDLRWGVSKHLFYPLKIISFNHKRIGS